MDSIQIWHMVVTSFEGVPYFKVTLNSYVYKRIMLRLRLLLYHRVY